MEKNTNYPFTFFEKTQRKRSLCNKFKNKPQTSISGTNYTVPIDKNKVILSELISNQLPFQSAVSHSERINTSMTTAIENNSVKRMENKPPAATVEKTPQQNWRAVQTG